MIRKLRQTTFGTPKLVDDVWVMPVGETIGNCFATCVACLLDMDLEDVPNFVDTEGDWWWRFQVWLEARGMYAIEINFVKSDDSRYNFEPVPGNIGCILTGKSPRGDHLHSVVGLTAEITCGDVLQSRCDVYHDPHPSDAGIEDFQSVTFIVKIGKIFASHRFTTELTIPPQPHGYYRLPSGEFFKLNELAKLSVSAANAAGGPCTMFIHYRNGCLSTMEKFETKELAEAEAASIWDCVTTLPAPLPTKPRRYYKLKSDVIFDLRDMQSAEVGDESMLYISLRGDLAHPMSVQYESTEAANLELMMIRDALEALQ
mgnify:CR=1 FL=1